METPASLIESLVDSAEAYGKTTVEIAKLKSLAAVTVVASSLVYRLCVIIFLSLFVLVLSIGASLLLGEMLGKIYYGFFVVASFYLVAALVFHFFLRQWIKKTISELIIMQALQ